MACLPGDVEVISRDLIKPSSSTPQHRRKYQQSFMDQLAPPVYITVVFFYEADEVTGLTSSTQRSKTSHSLKDSLSTTLTSFYPLAGKLNPEDFSITCDDGGVEFVEARAHSLVADVLKEPGTYDLDKYLPVDHLGAAYTGDREASLFAVQINYFDCGGIAVGACLSHFVGDGWSMVQLMNSWSAACRGENLEALIEFGPLGHNFPARDLSAHRISMDPLMKNGKLVRKRLVFGKEQLAALKKAALTVSAAVGEDSVSNPSRVEVATSFIWKTFIESSSPTGKNLSVAIHAVNVRSKASKSFQLDHAFGNAALGTAAFSGVRAPELPELVRTLRQSIRKIDDDYVRKTHSDLHYVNELSILSDLARQEAGEAVFFSSWCRFPIYSVDFGWGRPAWVCRRTGLHLNNAIFLNTKDGEGIEAFIDMPPERVEALEKQWKLIGVGSPFEIDGSDHSFPCNTD